MGTDSEIELLWQFYRHIFPDFSINHLKLYALLWKAEPRGGSELISNSGFSRVTVYGLLRELIAAGLVRKSGNKPIKYFTQNPARAYSLHSRKAISRIRAGRKTIKEILSGSLQAQNEIFFVKGENGLHRFLSKKTRGEITDESALREIRKAAEEQLTHLCIQKSRAWASYR